MQVLVLDGQYIAALAAVRSLGRAGARVHVGAPWDASHVLGFASRYAAVRHRLPDARRDAPAFREAVRRAAEGADVVLPCALASVAALAGAPEFEDRTLLPPPGALETAIDKARLHAYAHSLGLPVPRTYRAGETPPLPAVVKYRNGEALGLPPALRYAIARDAAALASARARMAAGQAEPLVQEWLPGEGRGCSAVCSRAGSPVAFFCHRRLREYPVTGGPSTWAESIHDPLLVDLTDRLLRGLGWRGHAMVEYKLDAHGMPRLLEINARPWGTYPLALAAGVDFPGLYCALALGRGASAPPYRDGVRLRFWAKDLLAARAIGARALAAAVRAEGIPAVFAAEDPWPSAVYAARVLSGRRNRGAEPA